MKGFSDLIVWREAASLAANVLEIAGDVRGPCAAYAIDQLVRAADSIPSNIAEGYGRGPTRDCLRFLRTSRASALELESHLRVAVLARRLEESRVAPLIDQVRRVQYLIKRFAESVERRIRGN